MLLAVAIYATKCTQHSSAICTARSIPLAKHTSLPPTPPHFTCPTPPRTFKLAGSLALQKTVDLNDLGFTPFEPPGDVEYPFSYSESPTFQTYEACQDSPEPFNYLLPEIPGVNRSGDIRDASVVVTLYNADVDNGQHNDVYLNGLYLGTAGGRQDTYSRTIFKFRTPAEWAGVKFNGEGGNTIRVVNQDPYDAWFTCLSWVQLVVRINHAPYVVPDQHYPTNEDTPLFVDAPGILINATDVDGDAFSITSYTNTTYGTLALNNYTGAFNYTNLRPNWNGVDSFEFTVTDQIGRSTTTTVYIDVCEWPPLFDTCSGLNTVQHLVFSGQLGEALWTWRSRSGFGT